MLYLAASRYWIKFGSCPPRFDWQPRQTPRSSRR
jgi:hypothetical protein